MKRCISVLAVAVMVGMLAGCGGSDSEGSGGSSIVGTWTLTKIDFEGAYGYSLSVTSAMGATGTVTFRSDGTCSGSASYLGVYSESYDGTYKLSGTTLVITGPDQVPVTSTANLSGSSLSISRTAIDGSAGVAYFSK